MSDTSPSTTPSDTPFQFQLERDFAGRQYIGTRKMQEDFYAFSDISDKAAPPLTNLLVALGDGLGAHIGGNLASYFLVNEFIKAYKRSTLGQTWRLRVALDNANEQLQRLSHRVAYDRAPMGTTLLAAAVFPEYFLWISVGDSPLFLFRNGELQRLNADHSLAPLLDERVKAGELTEEEAQHHPDRHILQSACMGQPLTLVDSRVNPFGLQSGDILIIASDGLLTLPASQITELLTFGKHTTAAKVADALIFAVRCADYPRQDNTSVAVIKMP